jgi:hypothetical protein
MTKNIDLEKKRRKSIIQKRLLWEMLASSFLIGFNPVPWWSGSKGRTLTRTNAFDYEIVEIISQLQFNEQWRFVAFFSRKMIFAEMNYKTHDQELLIIVECFKHWRHYLKKNYDTMKILIDHNNLKDFMNVKTLNEQQVKWAMRLINFDFIIKHRFEKINLVDDSSKRFDYHDVNTKIIRFLLIL